MTHRFRLTSTGALDVAHLFQVLQVHSLPIQETLDPAQGTIARLLRTATGWQLTELRVDAGGVGVTTEAPASAEVGLRDAVTHWLGLAQDGTAGLRRLSRDPLLGACARRHPHLRLISYPDFFEALVTTVLGQQISTRAARTLALRLVTALGVEHASGFHAFPEAARVAGTSVPDLVSIIRCPASRAATLQRVAQWYLDFGPSMKAPVPQLRQSLLALKGVGPWTVDYVALRGLRAPRVFLASDLVVRRALQLLGWEQKASLLNWEKDNALATVLLWKVAGELGAPPGAGALPM